MTIAASARPDRFEDLELLGKILAGVRVVHLGELSHGEGNGAALRSRVVRFLHQRLGFSVLIWEAGFYECHLMNDLLAGNATPDRIAAACLWPFWANNSEIRSLFADAGNAVYTAPLLMAGFDIQFTGRLLERRSEDIHRWFLAAGLPLPS